jgi:hypothetical protein
VSLNGLVSLSASVTPTNIGGEARLSKSCSGSGNVNVWRLVNGNPKGELLTLPWSWPLSHGTVPPLYVEGTATSSAIDDVTLTLAFVASGQAMNPHSVTFTVGLMMKLEEIGFAIGEPPTYPSYPEITTIRATAVSPDSQVCSSFTGTVYIGEDTSDPGYVPIYSQNGGSLPQSITFAPSDSGTKTFNAISLSEPPVPQWGIPNDARVRTVNLPVYNADYLAVEQWRDETQVDPCSSGSVYDWFETRTKHIFDSATGDLHTVLLTVASYVQTDLRPTGGFVNPAHQAKSQIIFNPHYREMRLDISGGSFCGRDRSKYHTDTVIHEGRHCYQNYLSVQWLGQNDEPPGQDIHPDNDDDLDFLVDVVPIDPNFYIVDTGVDRSTCSGQVHFQGDGQADGNAQSSKVFEKDAVEFTNGKY